MDLDPPKYDNIPLYIQNGKGKMGLIDLERFSIEQVTSSTSAFHFIEACSTAIQLYPYHFDTIIEIASLYDPDIELLRDSFEERRDEALLYFEKIYFAHERFLNKHGITTANPFKRVEISNTKRKKVISTLEKKLSIPLSKKNSFFKKTINTPHLRKTLLPNLMDQVLQYLQGLLEKKSGKVKELTDVMEMRTLKVKVLDYMQEEFLSEIFNDYLREDNLVRTLFTVWAMDQVLEALAEHEVILSFHNEMGVIQL